MTTTVKVHAHCDSETTEVKITNSRAGETDVIIQDKEKHELVISSDDVCTVEEVQKVVVQTQAPTCSDPLDEDC